MKLYFNDIAFAPKEYELDISDWAQTESGGVRFTKSLLKIWKKDPGLVAIDGILKGKVGASCGRCGSQVEKELQCEFEYFATTREEVTIVQQEMECPEEDVTTLYLNVPEIDLQEVLREQMILAIPLRTLCSEDCKGICSDCGADLNVEPCSCQADYSDSPFSVLSKLKS
jgi:uncharacterized protein